MEGKKKKNPIAPNFFFQNTKYFLHTHRNRRKDFKETDSGIYPKEIDSYIRLSKLFILFFCVP